VEVTVGDCPGGSADGGVAGARVKGVRLKEKIVDVFDVGVGVGLGMTTGQVDTRTRGEVQAAAVVHEPTPVEVLLHHEQPKV